jgi:hypothetical protein
VKGLIELHWGTMCYVQNAADRIAELFRDAIYLLEITIRITACALQTRSC